MTRAYGIRYQVINSRWEVELPRAFHFVQFVIPGIFRWCVLRRWDDTSLVAVAVAALSLDGAIRAT